MNLQIKLCSVHARALSQTQRVGEALRHFLFVFVDDFADEEILVFIRILSAREAVPENEVRMVGRDAERVIGGRAFEAEHFGGRVKAVRVETAVDENVQIIRARRHQNRRDGVLLLSQID